MEILAVIVGGYVIIMMLQKKVQRVADKHFDAAVQSRDTGDSIGQMTSASKGCANGTVVLIIGVVGIALIIGDMAAVIPPRGM